MANRHLSRGIVLQTLFEWDFSDLDNKEVGDTLERNVKEFAPGLNDKEFIENLAETVIRKKKIIDDIIVKAAPDWPLDKINVVDRNVLRIGLAELLFGDKKEVPPKVAINEAIELAKTYGGENSGRFVNGVLGAVYKELAPEDAEKIDDPKKYPLEQKGGAVVFSRDENDIVRFAMVHDVFGYWTLSKGSIEENETPEEGTVREIKEEINLDIKIVEKLGENEYIANHPEKGKIRKHVTYFLGESPFERIVLEKGTGGLTDAKWFTMDEIVQLTMYDDITEMLTKSIGIITKNK